MCMSCLLENVNPTLVFETKSGDLAVTRQGDGYVMDFPLNPPTKEVCGRTNTFMSQENASPINNSFKYSLNTLCQDMSFTLCGSVGTLYGMS